MSKQCVAGCRCFEGGEIAHHPNCDFYPESRTEMYDKLKQKLEDIHNQVKLPADIEILVKACLTNENLLVATYTQGLALKYKIQL